MRLQRQLRTMWRQTRKNEPPDVIAVFDRMINDLNARGVEFEAVRTGMQAPDFALPNQTGRTVSLCETLARGPVVLLFYRGEWCPYCCAQLRAMQLVMPYLKAAGAHLLAVSPELPDHSLTLAERRALDFDILSDSGAVVARSYGLMFRVPSEVCEVYRNGGIDIGLRQGRPAGEPWMLPIPATYVLSPGGVVRFARIAADFTQRPEPQAIIDLLLDRASAL